MVAAIWCDDIRRELSNTYRQILYHPYMLHTAKPTKLGEEAMSGVIHTDGTVRYQTVSDGPYRRLLERLQELELALLVINTSLNQHE